MHFNPWVLIGKPAGFKRFEYETPSSEPQLITKHFFEETMAEMKGEIDSHFMMLPLFQEQARQIKEIYEEVEKRKPEFQYSEDGESLIIPADLYVKLTAANKYLETIDRHRGRQASQARVGSVINIGLDNDSSRRSRARGAA